MASRKSIDKEFGAEGSSGCKVALASIEIGWIGGSEFSRHFQIDILDALFELACLIEAIEIEQGIDSHLADIPPSELIVMIRGNWECSFVRSPSFVSDRPIRLASGIDSVMTTISKYGIIRNK